MGCDYSAEDKQLHGSTTALLRFAVICPDRCATRPALFLLRIVRAAECSNSTQLLALPSLHSGQVAPPRTGPGAQMRALEKFRPVWDATARSGRIWKLEATKPWLEAGELMHGDHDPCLPRARRLREVTGRGGSGSLIVE